MGLPEARLVSAVPETLTARGPKRPPINGGESQPDEANSPT